jgi:multidrug resistance efflux pump
MKMKNIIRAPFDGHLKAILVSAGETVKQKQPLISPLLAQPRMVLLALVTGILN